MYKQHRERLLETLRREGAAAIFATGSPRIRNHDCEYRFRPDSDFWYLTGFAEPEAVLVLLPESQEARSVLFLRERVREEEIWNGRRLGVAAAPDRLGVDAAYPIGELEEKLPELLAGYRRLVYRFGLDEARDRLMIATAGKLVARAKTGIQAPAEWVSPAGLVHEQRLIKNEWELGRFRRAAEITAEAHLAAMREAAPGVNEAELDALIEYTFRRRGSTGPAYTNIVAGGPGACVLHYVENNRELVDGELLLIDAGAEWEYYATDVTRTFPVNGAFSPEQRALYEVVLEAQTAAVDAVRPGATFETPHQVAVERISRGLVELGLVEGPVERVIEEELYRPFYMHRTGHWLGLDVHDCGAYHVDGESRPFEVGMVTTIEPGLYVDPDDESVEKRWRGIGIRIEDDVLVVPGGREVLTEAVPKSVADVEAACGEGALQTTA